MKVQIEEGNKTLGTRIILYFENINVIFINDGIYSLSDSNFCLEVNFNWSEKMAIWNVHKDDSSGIEKIKSDIEKFISKLGASDSFYIANAYETDTCLLLTEKPEKIQPKMVGGGFEGHGTTALIEDCPKRLLILGQND